MCFAFGKGISHWTIFGIAIVILYSIVSYKNGFYGEMLIYLVIMLPMYIWGIVEWLKHKDGETKSVEVNSIKWKEWLIVVLCSIVAFIGFYLLLKALNTKELIKLYFIGFRFDIYTLVIFNIYSRCPYKIS